MWLWNSKRTTIRRKFWKGLHDAVHQVLDKLFGLRGQPEHARKAAHMYKTQLELLEIYQSSF